MPRVRIPTTTTACAHCTERVCQQITAVNVHREAVGERGEGYKEVEKNMKLKLDRVSRRMFRVSQTRLFTHLLASSPALSRTRNRCEQSYIVTVRYRYESWELIFTVVFFFLLSLNGKSYTTTCFQKHIPFSESKPVLMHDVSDRRAKDVVMWELKPGFLVGRWWRLWRLCGHTQGIRSTIGGEAVGIKTSIKKKTLRTFSNRRQLDRKKGSWRYQITIACTISFEKWFRFSKSANTIFLHDTLISIKKQMHRPRSSWRRSVVVLLGLPVQ